MIDWTHVQAALTRAGYPCGAIDGQPGEKTWTALFAYAAARPADDTIRALGRAGAAWIMGDAITGTAPRLAEFLAQTANETGGFTRFEENLSYTAANIITCWPKRFPTVQACAPYVGNPQALANCVYSGRMGNTQPGDGWRYRGRGCLQLTFRDNYALYGQITGLPLVDQPDLAANPGDSLVIAREFWRRAGVNDAVDAGDFAKARRLTNGGAIGLEAVAARRARLLRVLGA